APWSCPGDCGYDGEVTIDEILSAVSIAEGTSTLAMCVVADSNGDGDVTIDEILASVNSGLDGCTSPAAATP
ncbi:MAG TPA: hypothetical protein VMT89_11800, partial [Candidatus Acidoferrales bacterium]|nr:hypothetical protein [Candidatus Acidoferrales bacterium]